MLAFGTLGTIYGDIGTSPLYAIPHILGVMDKPTELDLLGIASLCFWMLTLSPLIKYCFITLYADDIGEGTPARCRARYVHGSTAMKQKSGIGARNPASRDKPIARLFSLPSPCA